MKTRINYLLRWAEKNTINLDLFYNIDIKEGYIALQGYDTPEIRTRFGQYQFTEKEGYFNARVLGKYLIEICLTLII